MLRDNHQATLGIFFNVYPIGIGKEMVQNVDGMRSLPEVARVKREPSLKQLRLNDRIFMLPYSL